MRSFTASLLAAALATCTLGVAAQQFPTRPVRMIVPFVAGGGADVTARRLAEQLGAAWKQPVVIQNSGGSGGVGTSMHLAGELLKSVAGIDLVHVPFKGANQVVAAIMGNEIQFIFQNAALVEGQVKGGRVKALGIASARRLGALPDLPTFE